MTVRSRPGPHTNTVPLNYDTVPPRSYHQIYTAARTCQGLGEGLLLLVTAFDNGIARFLKKKDHLRNGERAALRLFSSGLNEVKSAINRAKNLRKRHSKLFLDRGQLIVSWGNKQFQTLQSVNINIKLTKNENCSR